MNTTGLRLVAALGVLLLVGAAGATDAPAPEPNDYRMDDYRAPVPATLRGAAVLSTDEARAYWEKHDAVFIDVLPQPPRPVGLPASTIWRPKPRDDVPGSIWLPDTGYGALAPVMEQYFERGLQNATGGDRDRDARVLLSGKLLDVVERGEARGGAGLYACGLVSGRHRRLDGASPAAGGAQPGAATAGG